MYIPMRDIDECILMDESEFLQSEKTAEELRILNAIHPKQREFHLIPRTEDA